MVLTFRPYHSAGLGLLGLAGLAAGCQDGGPLAFTTGSGQLAAAPAPEPQPCADPANHDTLIQELLDAVNAERAKRQLNPLKLNATLMQIADFYACRLIDGRFFDHVDPYDGSTVDTRATDFGYNFTKIGENLGGGQPSVRSIMAEWIASPTHRANLLDPSFTEVGIAVKVGGEYGRYWVQEFGRALPSPQTPTGENPTASSPADPRDTEGATGSSPGRGAISATTAPAP